METPVSMLLLLIAAGIIIGTNIPDIGEEQGSDELINIRSAQAFSLLGCFIDYEIEGVGIAQIIEEEAQVPLYCKGGVEGISYSSDPGGAGIHIESVIERTPDDLVCLVRFSEANSDPLRIEAPHVQYDTRIGALRIEVCLPIYRENTEVFF